MAAPDKGQVMRARRDSHASAGHRGRTSARWGGAAAVAVAAGALSLTAGAAPASAAGGYPVTATIAVGAFPSGVAVDPAARTVYVANYGDGDGSVSVIDEATTTVTDTVAVGAGPGAVAVDPATHAVYVANGGADTVSGSAATAALPAGRDTITAAYPGDPGYATAAQPRPHHAPIQAAYPGNTSYQPSSATATPPS
jgi:YVTN family beta-propeller protein